MPWCQTLLASLLLGKITTLHKMIVQIVRAALFSMFAAATAATIAAHSPSETLQRTDTQTPSTAALHNEAGVCSWSGPARWSYQVGVAYITGSTIDEVMLADGRMARGPAAGQIYLLQVSYRVTELQPELFAQRYPIDVSVPLVLGVVDENASDAFLQYSGGVTLRWKRFPWNQWVHTQLETGVGLTYSQHVLAAERERHPGRKRSHLEFYWPVQLLFAHPRHRKHEVVLFLHHHSGGWFFHKGGANSLGIGYRFTPGER